MAGNPKLMARMEWATLEIYKRWCEQKGTTPQAEIRRLVFEQMGGGPNFPNVPEHIVTGVRREVREYTRSQARRGGTDAAATASPTDLPSPMGPCPNGDCPSRSDDWPERVMYGGDQPLLSVSSGRYRCNACGVSGP